MVIIESCGGVHTESAAVQRYSARDITTSGGVITKVILDGLLARGKTQ